MRNLKILNLVVLLFTAFAHAMEHKTEMVGVSE